MPSDFSDLFTEKEIGNKGEKGGGRLPNYRPNNPNTPSLDRFGTFSLEITNYTKHTKDFY